MRAQDSLGAHGERIAAWHLTRAGLTLLDHNWRCPDGELDLILADGDVLVICEVKTRSSVAFGDPLEAVVPAKAARIRRLAMQWMDAHPRAWRAVRFDVVGVVGTGAARPAVTHLRGAW